MSSNPSHGGLVGFGVTVALTIISTLLVALRFWSRKMSRFGLWLDDWLAVLTLLGMFWTLIITKIAVYDGGMGKPITQAVTDDPNSVTTLLKVLWVFEFAYLWSSPLMKLTVLAYYWRMFPTPLMKLGIWALTGVCAVWFVCVLVVNLVQCAPVSKFWDATGQAPGVCTVEPTMYYVAVAVPNMVVDLLTVVLPIYEVWHLKLSFWKKVGVCAIFIIGGIVVIASIVRLALLILFNINGTANVTQDLLLPWVSTGVEIGVAIIGSCLPCLMPLYRRFRYGSPDTRPSHGATYGYGYGSSQRSAAAGSKLRSASAVKRGGGAGPGVVSSGVSSSKLAAEGGPFERLESTTDASRDYDDDDDDFGDGYGGSGPKHGYYSRTTTSNHHHNTINRVASPGAQHDGGGIPLQGIHVRQDITVQRSDVTWLDDGK